MDKLSNKLRLVRSQSMGVGLGQGQGDKVPPHVAMRRTPSSSSQDGGGGAARQASIVLLDERRLEMLVQPRLYAGELLDLVASHCHLKEKEYFGLAVSDDAGHFTWLQLDRKVLEHDLPRRPAQLTVHFLVKFFIESIAHLSENRTIELFYLQARSLIFRGTLEVEADIVFQLAALALQAAHGDYADDASTRALVKKSPVLPASVLKEHPSVAYCEDRVIDHYKKTRGQTRGQAVVNYMTIVESMPTYGVHYFEVYDKRQSPSWLGLSCRGIAQYGHNDRKVPVRVFPWKQLENLYFRDKKFSIEVHDAKRVVQTLSSFNLYEDALKLDSASATGSAGGGKKDEALVDAIADSTTQVSVSRRSFNPGSIHVYVWFGKTQGLTKCIWQSAISQHQFYLDRKQAKMRHHHPLRNLKDIARDLTRSSVSLSSASSLSNLSRSGSTHSLALSGALAVGATGGAESAGNNEEGAAAMAAGSNPNQTEEAKRAKMEMVAALKARREALEDKLKEKERQLKELCIKEGELTGELPPEIPLAPGEPVPQIRRRVGTEFALSENLLKKPMTKEEEMVGNLELEYEIQSKITSAALKLANDVGAPKSVRKQRKNSYQQSQRKLMEIEAKLNSLKYFGSKHRGHKQRDGKAEGEDGGLDPRDTVSLSPQYRGAAGGGVGGEDSLRKGLSVPDLDAATRQPRLRDRSDSASSLDEDEVDAVSPRSCPSSPRKHSNNQTKGQVDTRSLEPNSPHRMPRMPTGYVPSSVYLRSSYRTAHFPTLGGPPGPMTAPMNGPPAPLVMTTAEMASSSSSNRGPRSATLPTSPFRNKYEGALTQCDSPVGLYNIPQQRTSQAFSSLDDLDALTTGASTSSVSTGHQSRQSRPHLQQAAVQQQRPLPPKPGQSVMSKTASHHLRMQSSSSHIHSRGGHAMFPRVGLEAAAAANAYPSLERSTKKKPLPTYSSAMANRELPALPSLSLKTAAGSSKHPPPAKAGLLESARSMEDLESLEAAGIHGRSKMQYREVLNGGTVSSSGAPPTFADAMLQASSTTNSLSHRLRSADEYPPHHSPGAALPPSMSGHNILGIRPLDTGGPYPTPLRASNATLLPGQTYPESSAKPLPSVASLQDVFFHHHQSSMTLNGVASTVSSATSSIGIPFGTGKKRETTFGLNDSVRTTEKDGSDPSPPPPPLFPKQYHQVVEQRRRSSLGSNALSPPSRQPSTASLASSSNVPVPPRSMVSESPAVNRRVKPAMSTPPAPPLPPTPSSSVRAEKARAPSPHSHPTSSSPSTPNKATVVTVGASMNSPGAASTGGNSATAVPATEIVPGKFVAYRESSKPFEMSDFYKYSTKYRKTSVSSLGDPGSEGMAGTTGAAGSGSDSSPRSSTASASGSIGGCAAPLSASAADSPQRPSAPKPSSGSKAGGDLGEDFSNEMLAWYQSAKGSEGAQGNEAATAASNAQNHQAPSTPGKPATLV